MDEKQMKEMVKKTFDTIAGGYDIPALGFFPKSAEHLPGYLALLGSEHVLDVATGTGTAAIALARSLPGGRVTGVDFSQGMLEMAKTKIAASGMTNVTLMQMDMQELEFPSGHFDAAACAFGVFFVQDMLSQVRMIADKVKKGGRFVMTTFDDSSFSPLAEMMFERLVKYGVDAPPETRKKLYTRTQCEALFREADLRDVSVGRKEVGFHLPDAGGWWEVVWNAGFRRYVSQVTEQERDKFREEHLREVQALASPEGIWLQVDVLYTTGVVG